MSEKNIGRRQFLKISGRTTAGALLAGSGLGMITTKQALAASARDDDDKYDFLMARVKFDISGPGP